MAALGLVDENRHDRGAGTPTHLPKCIGGSCTKAMLVLLVKASSMRAFNEIELLWVLSW